MGAESILADLAGNFPHRTEGMTMAASLTQKEVEAVEEILNRRNQAEIKVEQGKVVVIEIRRKRVN